MWTSMCDRLLRAVSGLNRRGTRRAMSRRAGLIERLEARQLLSASNGSAADLGRAAVAKETVHIFWNNFFGAEITEGNSGSKTITLNIVASPFPKKDIQVSGNFGVSGTGVGFADENDFAAESFTATIHKGEGGTTVQATIFGDLTPEFNENFVATITRVSSGVIDGAAQDVTIINDDTVINPLLPDVAFQGTGVVAGEEGDTQQFTLALDELSGTDVDVTVLLSGSGVSAASVPGDVQFAGGQSQLTVTIPAGNLTQSFNISLIDDIFSEPIEGYTVSILSATNANVADPSSRSGSILASDLPPTVSIDTETEISEGNEGTTSVPVNITLSEPVDGDVVVHFSIEMNKEIDGKHRAKKKDFVIMTGTATIAAGETTGTITAQVVGDTKHEEDESFLIRLTSADGAAISDLDNVGVVTILNDDGVAAPARGKSKRHK